MVLPQNMLPIDSFYSQKYQKNTEENPCQWICFFFYFPFCDTDFFIYFIKDIFEIFFFCDSSIASSSFFRYRRKESVIDITRYLIPIFIIEKLFISVAIRIR